jgi:hypothetical protein
LPAATFDAISRRMTFEAVQAQAPINVVVESSSIASRTATK